MMKKVKKGSALIALLALVLSVMVIPKAYAAIEVNTDAKCSLNFELSDVVFDEVKGLDDEIVVNLYKIADMDVVGNYTAVDGFTLGTINDETTAEAWQTMAADAMAVIEDKNITPIATSTVAVGFDDNLAVGLYLVVAENVKSDTYEYSFNPYLVSLPNNYYYSTGNDSWVYDVTTSLKPERADLYGDLVIEKDLLSYNATVGGATFVFQVEAVKDYKVTDSDASSAIGSTITASDSTGTQKVVYSDVVSITFDAAGKKSVLIENIPAGAEVTVTEVYSGGSYEAAGENEFTTTIIADEVVEAEGRTETVATVTFTNDYSGELNGGSGVVNHFEENGSGNWTWTSSPDSTN